MITKTRQEIWKNYYNKHKEELLKKRAIRRLENIEYYKKYEKERYAKDPEFYKNKHREYSKKNRGTINRYIKNKYAKDLQFKLKCILRARLVVALKGQKKDKTLDLIGCTIPELKIHIEKQFKNEMTWKNWKYKGWHIDHIKPISLFNLKNKKELLEACNYQNLQPMWSIDNHKKGNKIQNI